MRFDYGHGFQASFSGQDVGLNRGIGDDEAQMKSDWGRRLPGQDENPKDNFRVERPGPGRVILEVEHLQCGSFSITKQGCHPSRQQRPSIVDKLPKCGPVLQDIRWYEISLQVPL